MVLVNYYLYRVLRSVIPISNALDTSANLSQLYSSSKFLCDRDMLIPHTHTLIRNKGRGIHDHRWCNNGSKTEQALYVIHNKLFICTKVYHLLPQCECNRNVSHYYYLLTSYSKHHWFTHGFAPIIRRQAGVYSTLPSSYPLEDQTMGAYYYPRRHILTH